MIAVPFVPWNSVFSVKPGQKAVDAWMTPVAPLSNRRTEFDDVFRFDLMKGAELPHAIDIAGDGTGEPAEDIDAVNGLVDQGAAALGGPAALHRARVVFGRAIPLDVTIALEETAEAAFRAMALATKRDESSKRCWLTTLSRMPAALRATSTISRAVATVVAMGF